MRVSFPRSVVFGALWISLIVTAASGCRSGGTGWSTPSWLSWNNWGGTPSSSSTALAQNKPSTTVPRPSGQATPQATTSVAAGTGGAGGFTGTTNPRYATTTSNGGAYPATSQAYGSQNQTAQANQAAPASTTQGYGAQPASAYQQASTASQVHPTVGYQTGPYSMTGGAAAPSAYGQAAPSAYGQSGYPAAGGASWNAPPAAPSTGYGASAYTTADQRGMYGTQEASPYASDASQPGGYGGHGQQPAASTYGQPPVSPPAPSAATGPWQNYSQPSPNYQGSMQGAATAGQTASTYEPAAPSASSTASNYPAVPAALGTDASSYRPGSTAGSYGVQNAAYQQPQPAAGGAAAGGSYSYGNTYQR